ncbi:unnamed protein product [Vitrella brassicaformis CCMP3155]|uniref:Uncharacterized protein n=3 Tax=Vitrella brassicaformis TaxID=1169539 RepID=A0A0G4H3Y1_VITBC|nr:unnamed protein product [Vitrella brassicaformis CCMP3155]|eukprot:CEM38415.1 unnamed protein product [Vitrella brassicaformis CCMP3155]
MDSLQHLSTASVRRRPLRLQYRQGKPPSNREPEDACSMPLPSPSPSGRSRLRVAQPNSGSSMQRWTIIAAALTAFLIHLHDRHNTAESYSLGGRLRRGLVQPGSDERMEATISPHGAIEGNLTSMALSSALKLKATSLLRVDAANERRFTLVATCGEPFQRGKRTCPKTCPMIAPRPLVGLMMYFNFVVFLTVCASIFFVGTTIIFFTSDFQRELAEEDNKCTDKVLSDKELHQPDKVVEQFSMASYYLCVSLYAVLIPLTFFFHEDAIDEDELKIYFQEALGLSIVGVSVPYAYAGHERLVERLCDKIIEEADLKEGTYTEELGKPPPGTETLIADTGSKTSTEAEKALLKEHRGGEGSHYDDKSKLPDRDEIVTILEGLKGAGEAFVIFQTENDSREAIEQFEEFNRTHKGAAGASADKKLFRGTHAITLEDYDGEPQDVLWDGFSKTPISKIIKLINGVWMILVAISMWTLFIYLPYAAYVISLYQTPGKNPNIIEDSTMGLIIAGGNAVMGEVVLAIARWAGFRRKDTFDIYCFVLNFLAVEMNMLFDLGICVVAAIGQQKEALSTNEAAATADLEKGIADQFWGLLIPGCLVLPYLALPIVIHGLPFFLGRWQVLHKQRITAREAEKLMECVYIDLSSQYGDFIINTSTCLVLLFFVTQHAWSIFLFLVLFALYHYIKDLFLCLRLHKETYFSTGALGNSVIRLWSVPTGMLCGSLVYWHFRHFLGSSPRMFQEHAGEIIGYTALAFFGHIFLYLVVIDYVIPAVVHMVHKPCSKTYKEIEAVTPCTYFNSNPIHVLKSHYCPKPGQSPITPYEIGKEYLQGAYFKVDHELEEQEQSPTTAAAAAGAAAQPAAAEGHQTQEGGGQGG